MSDIAAQYKPYMPIYIPSADKNIEVEEGNTKYVITQRVVNDAIQNVYYIKVYIALLTKISWNYVVGIFPVQVIYPKKPFSEFRQICIRYIE